MKIIRNKRYRIIGDHGEILHEDQYLRSAKKKKADHKAGKIVLKPLFEKPHSHAPAKKKAVTMNTVAHPKTAWQKKMASLPKDHHKDTRSQRALRNSMHGELYKKYVKLMLSWNKTPELKHSKACEKLPHKLVVKHQKIIDGLIRIQKDGEKLRAGFTIPRVIKHLV